MDVDFAASRQALVSETAFALWSIRRSTSTSASSQEIAAALSDARSRLRDLQVQGELDSALSGGEQQAVRELASRIQAYIDEGQDSLLLYEIEPRLPGCGVITGGVPDIVATYLDAQLDEQTRIIEVKAVARTFRSSDFRQLTAYAVLYFASKGQIPGVLALFNPVRGTSIEVGANEFFEDVADAPADEVIQRLLDDWTTPGVSL